MQLIDFTTVPIWGNGAILAVGGATICLAGMKLAKLADEISATTRLSKVLAGALLIGAATSLPEIVTTATASALGNAPLAVNNLFGGVAMQLVVLAAIDFFVVRDGPLTFFSPAPVLLLSGVLLILQIALSITAIATGDHAIVWQIGGWPLVLGAVYAASLYFMNQFPARETWTAARLPDRESSASSAETDADEQTIRSTTWLGLLFGIHCLLVLVGGIAVSTSADALASQTGLGSGFVGATLVAVTTSLPEISTTAGAVRLGSYTMAISAIFGTNALEVALLLPADIAYRSGAVMNYVDDSSLLMASLAIVMTALYVWGLLERRDKSVLRMGVDSWLVVLTYGGGLIALYHLAE